MKNTELPPNLEIVWVTYKRTVVVYYGSDREEVVRKKGFYSTLLETFSVPPSWAYFKGVLLPHGMGGDHLKPHQIIEWESLDKF